MGIQARTIDFGRPTVTGSASYPKRNDLSLTPNLFIAYQANNWLTISLHNKYEYRDTGDFTIPMYSGLATGSYNYYDAFLRLTLRY